LALAQIWRENYYLLYVLLHSRGGKRRSGRCQSPGPLSYEEVAGFCRHFHRFLETDARHHLWIGSTVGAGTLVYDHHNWICGYGDLAAYTEILTQRGMAR
jgi:hypothetical protein